MTEAQREFVAMEKRFDEFKQFLKDLEAATIKVAQQVGINGYFQDDDGTVYKIVLPKGQWVEYRTVGYERTRRSGEQKGTLSLKQAKEAGFEVNE